MVEQNVEVDPFIGQTFGEGGHLRVVERAPNNHSNRRYFVKCSNCEKDPELYGDAIFLGVPFDLRKGRIPCGCSTHVHWTEAQWQVRIEREATNRNYKYLGFEKDWSPKNTKVHFKCLFDGALVKITAHDFMSGHGCRTCAASKSSKEHRIDKEDCIKSFMSTGVFKEGTVFTELPRGYYEKAAWTYTCPSCSTDKYVEAGACSGVFKGTLTSFSQGRSTCRCNKQRNWTEEERIFQIKELLESEKSDLQFVKILDYEGQYSKVETRCPTHGIRTTTIKSFMKGVRCTECAKTGYQFNKQGFLYVFVADSVVNSFVGYGITNFPKQRISTHTNNLKGLAAQMSSLVLYTGTGEDVYNAEKFIKKNFEIFRQDVKGFRTEATYTKNREEIIQYLDSKLERTTL